MVKFGLLIDHYVTVLEVTETHVIVGDPLTSLTKLSREEFDRRWRRIGIVLSRTEPKAQ
jgi:predicted double-glycine peptidase